MTNQKIVATLIQYDTYRLETVTYCENITINVFFISRSQWRFSSRLMIHCDTQ